jgi:heptosyltransferase III
MSHPASVLVINVSRIGDTLFVTPAVHAIAVAWPTAKITVLAHPNRAEVLQNLPFVAQVGEISKRQARWRGRFSAKQYDYAFVYGFDEVLISYAQRVAHRVIAFHQKSKALNRGLYRTVEFPAFQTEHAVVQALRLPAAVGVAPAGLRIAYQPTEAERTWAKTLLENEDFAGRQPLIGLQVASFPTKGYRDWPIENFAALCKRLSETRPQAGFLIFGGHDESTRTAWLKQQLGDHAVLLAGKLTLRQTGAMMSCLDTYVGVDTGPTHIMSAYDIPIVGLYHCLSSTTHTGPLDHPLNYCLDHPCPAGTCTDQTSMAGITVGQVFARVEEALTARVWVQ